MKTVFPLIALLFVLVGQTKAQTEFVRVETIAGNGESSQPRSGPALDVSISNPFGVHPTPDGGLIIVSFDKHVIFKMNADGQLKIIGGTGNKGAEGTDNTAATTVEENGPHEVQVDAQGNVYVADTFNHRVGVIDAVTGLWKSVAGTGKAGFAGDGKLAKQALFNQAYSIALDKDSLFVADLKNHRIRLIDLKTGQVETICGTGKQKMPVDGQLAISQPLAGPRSLAVDSQNIWVVLREGNSVWRIDRSSNRIYHVAGTGKRGFTGDDGPARKAKLSGPKGIAVDPGRAIYIADTENHAIRKVDLKTGIITTVIGATGKKGFDGDGKNVATRKLARPHGVFLMPNGDLLVGDSENHRVRRLVANQ